MTREEQNRRLQMEAVNKDPFNDLADMLIARYGDTETVIVLAAVISCNIRCEKCYTHMLEYQTILQSFILCRLTPTQQKLYSDMLHSARFELDWEFSFNK